MEREIKPWYREPWPWVVIGALSFVVLASFVTLGIAIWSYDGLVADDYYKKGKEINVVLERQERSAALGLSALLTLSPDDETAQVVLQSGVAGFKPPQALHLWAVHSRFPGQDREAMLISGEDGIYRGHFIAPTEGRWEIVLEGDNWRLPILRAQAPVTEVRWERAVREP
ncbi:MAG: FixH family protein [Proteobacteria bacterium]|nr:FixH family protein [Pseudomonadota bacterium]MCL2307110.1 FixH family protein [Pseudomonadota bacterium]